MNLSLTNPRNSEHPETSRYLRFSNPRILCSFTHPFSYNPSEDSNVYILCSPFNYENPETSRNIKCGTCAKSSTPVCYAVSHIPPPITSPKPLQRYQCFHTWKLYTVSHIPPPTTSSKIPIFPYLESLLTQSTKKHLAL